MGSGGAVLQIVGQGAMPEEAANTADKGKCPICGSEQIDGGFINIEGVEAVQEMTCTECGASWDEVYTFSRRYNIEP